MRQNFELAQNIWTATKHFGTCKRTRHKTDPEVTGVCAANRCCCKGRLRLILAGGGGRKWSNCPENNKNFVYFCELHKNLKHGLDFRNGQQYVLTY